MGDRVMGFNNVGAGAHGQWRSGRRLRRLSDERILVATCRIGNRCKHAAAALSPPFKEYTATAPSPSTARRTLTVLIFTDKGFFR